MIKSLSTLKNIQYLHSKSLTNSLNKQFLILRLMSTEVNHPATSDQIVRSTAASGSQVYESRRAVDEYMLFHYGLDKDIMPLQVDVSFALKFTERCAFIGQNAISKYNGENGRVLDLGCAVGGLSFQLSRFFREVVGVDFSHHFVAAANKMKSDGVVTFDVLKQGAMFYKSQASLSADIDPSRVEFFQGDACNLSHSIGEFDLIIGSNLLCRLPNPRKFLLDAPKFLKPSGLLMLVSPYSWLDEYTSREEWIGGENGKESFSVLKEFLQSNNLELLEQDDIPFLIREHERKFQLGVSHLTIWRKRGNHQK